MSEDLETQDAQEPAPPARARRRMRSAHDARERRRKFVTWSLVLVSFILIVDALFGENGYLASIRAQQEYRTVAAAATRAQNENQRTLDLIRGIKSDPAVLEEEIRRELGYVRPGESLVIIRNARSASPAPVKQ